MSLQTDFVQSTDLVSYIITQDVDKQEAYTQRWRMLDIG